MEGLSAAASGIAVVTVAVQLAESFKKLCDFWKSIKEAPEDIRAISVDLEILSNVLTQIAHETQHFEPDATLIAALNGCCVKVKILNKVLNEIEPGFSSTKSRVRQWSALKAVLKRGELMKFQVALDRIKATFLLVQQHQNSRMSRNRHNSLELRLATIAQSFSRSSVQKYSEIAESNPSVASDALRVGEQHGTGSFTGNVHIAQDGPPNSGEDWSVPQRKATSRRTLKVSESVIEGFLGSIRARSATVLQSSRQTADLTTYHEQDQHEYKTSYTISPAPWLVRLGLHYGLHLGFLSSTQGWKNTLKTFCPVPDDALIFEFCRQGNVPAVRSLLSGGHASVRDTDSRGYTPLHAEAANACPKFAAQAFHPELCQFLKIGGADTATLTHDAKTPIRLAADQIANVPDLTDSELFDTLRLLTDSMDFSDEEGDGWHVLMDLFYEAYRLRWGKVFVWMMRLLSFELKTNAYEQYIVLMLAYIISNTPAPERYEVSDLLLNMSDYGVINAPVSATNGYSALHIVVSHAHWEDNVSATLARGPDRHLRGLEWFGTPFEESPTSLAMYTAEAFSAWLHALANVDVGLENLIDQELELNYELHPGWEKETLLKLFAHGGRPDLHHSRGWTCSDCLIVRLWPVRVQPYWRHLLERIKARMHPYDPVTAVSEVDEDENDDLGSPGDIASSSNDLTHGLDATGNVPLLDPDEDPSEVESDMESEADVSGNPTLRLSESICLYGKRDLVCMDCWLHYERTGTRYQPDSNDEDSSEAEDFASSDDSSECEYSPYLIHS